MGLKQNGKKAQKNVLNSNTLSFIIFSFSYKGKKTVCFPNYRCFSPTIICFPQICYLILLTIISSSREHLIPRSSLISLLLHWPTTGSWIMLLQCCITSSGAFTHWPDKEGNWSQTQLANNAVEQVTEPQTHCVMNSEPDFPLRIAEPSLHVSEIWVKAPHRQAKVKGRRRNTKRK